MSDLKPRRSSRALVAVYTLGMLYVLLSLDWRGRKPLPAPRVTVQTTSSSTEWRAGAAKVELDAELPATIAGFPPPRATAKTSGPLSARALVLAAGERAVGLVNAEVLEIPQRVASRVRARGQKLGLADVAVAATHTHSSFGGYDRNPLVEIGATGRFEQRREEALAARLEEALEKAYRSLEPARLRASQVELPGVVYNRARHGAPVEGLLSALAVDDAIAAIIDKLIRRHPHVFGDATADTAAKVAAQWSQIKERERSNRPGDPDVARTLAGVPAAMPALSRAQQLTARAAQVGFDWPDTASCRDKLTEELGELDHAIGARDPAAIQSELGDLLFAVVNLARKLDCDAEACLRGATRRFVARFEYIEDRLRERAVTPRESSPVEMDALWDAAKRSGL